MALHVTNFALSVFGWNVFSWRDWPDLEYDCVVDCMTRMGVKGLKFDRYIRQGKFTIFFGAFVREVSGPEIHCTSGDLDS